MLMNVAQAAGYLGRTEHWVRQSIADGTLPARKVRGRWVLSRPQLDAWCSPGGAQLGGPEAPRAIVVKPRRSRRAA